MSHGYAAQLRKGRPQAGSEGVTNRCRQRDSIVAFHHDDLLRDAVEEVNISAYRRIVSDSYEWSPGANARLIRSAKSGKDSQRHSRSPRTRRSSSQGG